MTSWKVPCAGQVFSMAIAAADRRADCASRFVLSIFMPRDGARSRRALQVRGRDGTARAGEVGPATFYLVGSPECAVLSHRGECSLSCAVPGLHALRLR